MKDKRVVYDCHSHTYLCGHAESILPRVYHAVANAQQMRGIAFCCHNPFLKDDVTSEYRMPFKDFENFLMLYKSEKLYAVDKFPELDLTLHMEVDYHPQDPSKTKEFVDLCGDFDCLLGSLHYYHETSMVQPEQRVTFIKNYVDTWKQAVQTGWFNIMSHYDFFKARFGMDWYLENMSEYEDDLLDGLSFLAETNKQRILDGLQPISLECNTGGIQYGSDLYLPTASILEQAVARSIPITLGSDCHDSLEVGRKFENALTDLQKMGLSKLSYYKRKKMRTYSVQEAIDSFKTINVKEVVDKFKQKNDCYVECDSYY
ncbi:Histidinol-phosphatase [Hexamita inflata]|uniref:Histidinol-phosphatase n=1 Tax=Hexamita inflata TaxID=28002 RepID=A0AA86QRV9_9EUKA|nr:Histidinol-phosphatase [Hexamita inflata]